MSPPIRVVVADDSAVTREYLRLLLDDDPGCSVVGVAGDGQEAVALVERLRPDVVLMDVHMPRTNGHEAARRIMERVPTPIVLASASSGQTHPTGVFEALAAGALTVVEKPFASGGPDEAASAAHLVQTVKLMSEVKVVRRWPERPARAPAVDAVEPSPARQVAVVAIGASTGGPPVVAEILSGVREARCPIVVVQHIAADFATGLADWLGRVVPLPVLMARHGQEARPGVIYVAPPGAQTGLSTGGRLLVTDGPPIDGFAPSATHLFRSVARACGPSAIGVLLTGMGRDGAAGLQELRRAGATTIVQDAATSVVFGMPREAIALGAAQHVLPPAEIARTLRGLLARARPAEPTGRER